MPQYLVAIHHPDNYDPSLEGEAMVRDIDVLGVRHIKLQDGPDLSSGVVSRSHRRCSNMGLRMKFCWSSIRSWLGTGKRIFAEGSPPRSLELIRTKGLPSGIVVSFYKAAGPLKTA